MCLRWVAVLATLMSTQVGATTPLPVPLGEGYWSYITPEGELLGEQRFDAAYAFSDGMAQVQLGVQRRPGVFDHSTSKWGFVDTQAKLVIPAEWESSGRFADGLAPVRRDGRWGYVDAQGQLRIPLEFQRAMPFSEGLAAVQLRSGLWNYIDTQGKPVFVPLGSDMSDPRPLRNGRVVLDLGRTARVVDRAGETLFEMEGFIRDFQDGKAAFRQDAGWGVVDRDGSILVPAGLPFVWSPSDGLMVAQQNGQSGYMDVSGQWVIEPRFAQANVFSEGLAFVAEKALFGYIDRSGQWRIPPQFNDPMDSASAFRNGRARVDLADGRGAWIDASGTIIWSQPEP